MINYFNIYVDKKKIISIYINIKTYWFFEKRNDVDIFMFENITSNAIDFIVQDTKTQPHVLGELIKTIYIPTTIYTICWYNNAFVNKTLKNKLSSYLINISLFL